MSKLKAFRGAVVERAPRVRIAHVPRLGRTEVEDTQYRLVLADGRATEWREDVEALAPLAAELLDRPILVADVRAVPRKTTGNAA